MNNNELQELAKLAKDKGFTVHTVTTKFTNDYLLGGKNVMITEMCIYLWMCELQKWLREKHHLIIIVAYQYEHDSTPYSYWIYKELQSLPINQWVNDLNTYEEALEAGLQKALSYI